MQRDGRPDIQIGGKHRGSLGQLIASNLYLTLNDLTNFLKKMVELNVKVRNSAE